MLNDLKNMGFKGSYPDPCLLWRNNVLGVIFIALYVDDYLFIGDKYAVASLEKEFVNAGFQVTLPE